ncbi:MAG: hypothetical protein IIT96_01305, partial [Muribaculaceae bacterium]|nr:hypothetical protein [Muribaculaceae bacterium]
MKISAPLSKSQYGLYVDCASHLGEARYNLPYIYVLDGSLDGERLCASVVAAFKSHPTMLVIGGRFALTPILNLFLDLNLPIGRD